MHKKILGITVLEFEHGQWQQRGQAGSSSSGGGDLGLGDWDNDNGR